MFSLDTVRVELGGRTVVDTVTTILEAGRVHVVAGPNGAGKSTLLRAMAALLPLKSGRIIADDKDMARLSPSARAGLVAYLPQDRSLAWDLAAADVAALGAYHLPPDVARQKAVAELQALGLGDVAERGVFSLSGGQRARVLLARLLLSPARLYLLDEPLTALDPAWQRQVLHRLRQRASEGYTVVLSLHDLQLAAQFADDILLMHEGRLVANAAPEKVFTPGVLHTVFNLSGGMVSDNGRRRLDLDVQPAS